MNAADLSTVPKDWEISHICIAVPDLDAWRERFSLMFGTQWSSPVEIDHVVTAPRAEGGTKHIRGRGRYGSGSKPWVELFEGAPGSPWEVTDGQARLHHIGYWADDMEAAARQLETAGYELEYANRIDGREEALIGWAYYRQPDGIRIEIHEGGDRAAFRRWVDEGQPLVVDWGVEAP
ncbi:VOC family protein [Conexibacter sp. CPCC 206217]|uniref:VOC family protein n=1 Tax=Conexibacter sp. CPCC 206217 TaxID=3064574 RepID=UPI002720B13B|nr:VOC family protein [Conexibacter sp. CPCC 206217]MDO8209603.1 VOC family protein [Conexibacter sp. CPCC 206217]